MDNPFLAISPPTYRSIYLDGRASGHIYPAPFIANRFSVFISL